MVSIAPCTMTNREVPSRCTASAVISPSMMARRYPSPSFGRPSSPSRERCSPPPSELSVLKRASSAEKRPLASDVRRPWPSAAMTDAKSFVNGGSVNENIMHSAIISGKGVDGLCPAKNLLSTSSQLDTSSRGPPNDEVNGKLVQDSQPSNRALKPTANGAHRTSSTTSGTQAMKNLERKASMDRKMTPDRARTPVRRQTSHQGENAKPFENLNTRIEPQRWPGVSSTRNSAKGMSKSMDLMPEKEPSLTRVASVSSASGRRGITNPKALESISSSQSLSRCRSLSCSINEEAFAPGRRSFDGKLARHDLLKLRESFQNEKEMPRPGNVMSLDSDVGSDTESTSSGSSPNVSIPPRGSSKGSRRGTLVPARFWQDMASRFSRAPCSVAPANNERVSRSSATDSEAENKTGRYRKPGYAVALPSTNSYAASSFAWTASPGRSTPSGLPSPPPSSLNKSGQLSSPSRGSASPTRTRISQFPFPLNFSFSSRPTSVSGILNFGLDARKGKKGSNQQEDAYELRILHNRWLQWRFVNARAEAALQEQKLAAENLLGNVWSKTSELRDSVAKKRAQLQQEKQAFKLHSILSSQAAYLESWQCLQHEHLTALTRTMKILETAATRVPVVAGAKIDAQALKEALGSATAVLNGVSSVSKLLPKAEEMDVLLSELAKTAAKERAFLEECGDLLAAVSTLETEECSLQSHLMQKTHGR